MSKSIIVTPSEMWKFCKDNAGDFQNNMFRTAYNDEFGINIYVSSDETGSPCLIVEQDDIEIELLSLKESTCKGETEALYDAYLTGRFIAEDFGDYEPEMSMVEREDELDNAVEDFVAVVCPTEKITPEMLNDLKEHFLEYMARKHNLKIFRPMELVDRLGKEFEDDYPYDLIEFEKDPLYT